MAGGVIPCYAPFLVPQSDCCPRLACPMRLVILGQVVRLEYRGGQGETKAKGVDVEQRINWFIYTEIRDNCVARVKETTTTCISNKKWVQHSNIVWVDDNCVAWHSVAVLSTIALSL